MPRGLREFGDDVEKKIRQVLQAQLTRMDLVNREEFDVQTQVLLRTREKLAVLEQRLAALEGQSGTATSTPSTPASATAAVAPAPGITPAAPQNATATPLTPASRARQLLRRRHRQQPPPQRTALKRSIRSNNPLRLRR